VKDKLEGRLITELSITSATAFMSWVLTAEVITVDNGIPFLYVKRCLFVPILLLSTGIISFSHRPPKADFIDMLSSDCHVNLIHFLLSYSFNNLTHIFLKMPN